MMALVTVLSARCADEDAEGFQDEPDDVHAISGQLS
jgi:hypothetical protein